MGASPTRPLQAARRFPARSCRAPGPEACGKAIKNLGSVVTFRIWGVFTSNWSIVSLGERKVKGGNPGKGNLLSPGRGANVSLEDHDSKVEFPGHRFAGPLERMDRWFLAPLHLVRPGERRVKAGWVATATKVSCAGRWPVVLGAQDRAPSQCPSETPSRSSITKFQGRDESLS